jgi:uncharacterized protein (DUF58 family)
MIPSQRFLVLAVAIALPTASIGGLYPTLFVPCVLVGAAMVLAAAFDAFRGAATLRQIEVSAPPFVRFTKNVGGSLPITIRNSAAHPIALRIGATPPESIESEHITLDAAAAPGASVIDWPVLCRARGDYILDVLHLESPSPWGLWLLRESRRLAFHFRVYPNLRDRATAALFRKTSNAGFRMRRQVGKGREFDNLRHYIPGDSFEDIHWKATARRAFPIVKLYRVEHAQEVYAVIDASRLSMREGVLDSYVDAALHLALVAERQGDRFGLVTFSDRTHQFVRARNGMDHFRLCRETIYNLSARRVSPDFRDVFNTLQINLRRRSLLVFFTSLDDALLAETFEREAPIVARRHVMVVNITQTAAMKPLFIGQPPASLDALYDNLTGQMIWNRMRTLQLALQNRGIRLHMVEPGRIKSEVTSEYLEVKRRQLL